MLTWMYAWAADMWWRRGVAWGLAVASLMTGADTCWEKDRKIQVRHILFWTFIHCLHKCTAVCNIYRRLSRCKQLGELVPVFRLWVSPRYKTSKLWYPLKIPPLYKFDSSKTLFYIHAIVPLNINNYDNHAFPIL